MKKINSYLRVIGVLIVFLSTYSCADLEESKPGALSPETFLENQTDAFDLLTGAYAAQYTQTSYHKAWIILNDIASDDCGYIFAEFSNRVELDRFISNPEYPEYKNMWWHHYMIINRAGLVIQEVAKMDDNVFDSPAIKKRIIAEAKFLRAYNYFNLIRMFGDVPFFGDTFVNDPVGAKTITREKVDVIYDFIIKELTEAEADLGIKLQVEKGRATRGAAQAVLSKVYLTRAGWRLDATSGTMVEGNSSNWALAAEVSKRLIEENDYNLVDSFAFAFPVDENTGDEDGPEHIFFINSTMQAFHETNLYYGPRRNNGSSGYSSYVGEVELFNKFDNDNDKRVDATYLTYVIDKDKNSNIYNLVNTSFIDTFYWGLPNLMIPHIGKYLGDEEDYEFPPKGNPSATNIPLFRYSEVLLIYAEAENEVTYGNTDAINAFNKVRHRAGLSEWPTVNDTDGNLFPTTQDGFRQAIRQERRFELAFEQKRLFDLRRWGSLVDIIKARATASDATVEDGIRATNVTINNNLFPIPYYEIQRNPNLKQNPY